MDRKSEDGEKKIAAAKVTIRNQIAIPKRVKAVLGEIKPGDYIIFYEKDGEVFIKRGEIKPKNSK